MFGHTFYHETLRKYVIVFGTLFNEVHFYRTDDAGNRHQKIRVPLSYGPREKTLARLEGDPNLDRETAITLPRMAFEMTGLAYASERKLNTIRKRQIVVTGENSKMKSIYQPVPYDIAFQLNIMVNRAEDGTKIIEQIMPFFTPEFTVSANILPEMDYKLDIPVILDSVNMQDTYEGDFQTRRALIYQMDFTLKGFFFGPVSKSGQITRANTQFFIDTSVQLANSSPSNTVVAGISTSANVQHSRRSTDPGLDANGNPTSNSSVTIGRENISANDNFGFVSNFEEFFSGDANTPGL
tara:strand:- start:1126 stop:2013 length:888 start_codon:yes stop_codon:yes gene_type:complete